MIAIHHSAGSFSDRWIKYCMENNIPFILVSCYSTNIIEQLKECDGLMWHWSHSDYREQNFARQFIFSVEKSGIKVFPDYNTCWHFDDKVGQKYLLESIRAPLVPTYTFYNEVEALKWIEKTIFPKVFKLRGGAGAQNVMILKNIQEARKITNKAFNSGFPLVSKSTGLKQRFWVLKRDKNFSAVLYVIKGFMRYVIPIEGSNLLPRQKGYVYFQDFIPGNEFDDRVIVIGEKAIAIRRYNRKDDFRASGSGLISNNPELFNKKIISIAFNIAQSIESQSTAFDFIYNQEGTPLIIEISYGFSIGAAYDNCEGYWDRNLNWHVDNVDPQRYIIEDFLQAILNKHIS